MNKTLLLLLTLVSTPVYSYICRVDFTTSDKRADETELLAEEISHYNLFIEGKEDSVFAKLRGGATRHMWWSTSPCPVCSTVFITTVDTEGRESDFSTDACLALPASPSNLSCGVR